MMQASASLVDFWLRFYVTGSTTLDFINKMFDNKFTQTFMFLILLNLGITITRGVFYSAWALRTSYKTFNSLNSSIIFSKMKFFENNSIGRIVNRLSNDVLMLGN